MTIDDFQRLCQEQWARPERGDVTKLWLTDESVIELTVGVTGHPEYAVHYAMATPSRRASAGTGDYVSRLLNPVTRTAVAITPGNPEDTAVVFFGAHSPEELVAL